MPGLESEEAVVPPAKEEVEGLSNRALNRTPVDDTVVLRAEAISDDESKALTVIMSVGELLAVGILVAEVALKFTWDEKAYLQSVTPQWWNFAIALACLACTLSVLPLFISRIFKFRHKHWGQGRKFVVGLTLVESGAVVVSLVCMVVPNLYVIAEDCTWFGTAVVICAFLVWTSWNTLFMLFFVSAKAATFWKRHGEILRKGGREQILIEAPFTTFWPAAVAWVIFEAVNIALLVIGLTDYSKPAWLRIARCGADNFSCRKRRVANYLLVGLCAAWLLWIAAWILVVYCGLKELRRRPWHGYKAPNVMLRSQFRLRGAGLFLFVCCLVLLGLVRFDSCVSYIDVWLGVTPLAFLFTTMNLCALLFFMPKDPLLADAIAKGLLQQFSWLEAQWQQQLEHRNRQLHDAGQDVQCIQPMFCFETAGKAFYFSALVYDYQEEEAASIAQRNPEHSSVEGCQIEVAMQLYNLEQFELVIEPAADTKLLICWNKDTVVLSFRGTASMANAWADVQVWLSVHPPKRGSAWRRPRVHSGFLAAWVANGLHGRVLERLKAIFQTPGVVMKDMLVLTTGHSLGGAIATLAAYDIAKAFEGQLKPHQVQCYTLGAPRTGNAAFANDYNQVVPETWHIITTNDIIPQVGKLGWTYKRPGRIVIINELGDMLVRPNYIERTTKQHTVPFQASVSEHLLACYQSSLIAVCTAQFGPRAFRDGMENIQKLLATSKLEDALRGHAVEEKRMAQIVSNSGYTVDQLEAAVGVIKSYAKAALHLKHRGDHDGQLHSQHGIYTRHSVSSEAAEDRARNSDQVAIAGWEGHAAYSSQVRGSLEQGIAVLATGAAETQSAGQLRQSRMDDAPLELPAELEAQVLEQLWGDQQAGSAGPAALKRVDLQSDSVISWKSEALEDRLEIMRQKGIPISELLKQESGLR